MNYSLRKSTSCLALLRPLTRESNSTLLDYFRFQGKYKLLSSAVLFSLFSGQQLLSFKFRRSGFYGQQRQLQSFTILLLLLVSLNLLNYQSCSIIITCARSPTKARPLQPDSPSLPLLFYRLNQCHSRSRLACSTGRTVCKLDFGEGSFYLAEITGIRSSQLIYWNKLLSCYSLAWTSLRLRCFIMCKFIELINAFVGIASHPERDSADASAESIRLVHDLKGQLIMFLCCDTHTVQSTNEVQLSNSNKSIRLSDSQVSMNQYLRERKAYENNNSLLLRLINVIFDQSQGPVLLEFVCIVGPSIAQLKYSVEENPLVQEFVVKPTNLVAIGDGDQRIPSLSHFAFPNDLRVYNPGDAAAERQLHRVLYQPYQSSLKKTSLFCWHGLKVLPESDLKQHVNPYSDLFLIEFQYLQYLVIKDRYLFFKQKLIFGTYYPHLGFLSNLFTNLMRVVKFKRLNRLQEKNKELCDGEYFTSQFRSLCEKVLSNFFTHPCKPGKQITFTYLEGINWTYELKEPRGREQTLADFLGKGFFKSSLMVTYPQLLQLISQILLQSKVLIFCKSQSRLSFFLLFLKIVMRPIQYAGIWVFITPRSLLEGCCQSPTPMVFGVAGDKDLYNELVQKQEQLYVYDLDLMKACGSISKQKLVFPNQPKLKESFSRVSSLGKHLQSCGLQADEKQQQSLASFLVDFRVEWEDLVLNDLRKHGQLKQSPWNDQFAKTQTFQLLQRKI